MEAKYSYGHLYYYVTHQSEDDDSLNITTVTCCNPQEDEEGPSFHGEDRYCFIPVTPAVLPSDADEGTAVPPVRIPARVALPFTENELAVELVTRSSGSGERAYTLLPSANSAQFPERTITVRSDSELERVAKGDTTTSLYINILYIASQETFRLLLAIPRLQGLRLAPQAISNQLATLMLQFDELSFLNLDYCRLDDMAFETIITHRSLRCVDIAGTNLDDSMCGSFAARNNIVSLQMGDTLISGDGLRAVSKCTSLESLSIRNCRQCHSGGRYLSDLTHLRGLDVSGTDFSARSLIDVAAVETMELLSANSTQIDDSVLTVFSRHPSLRAISLGGGNCTAMGVCRFILENPDVGVVGKGFFTPFRARRED